jgi:hypothetical protein
MRWRPVITRELRVRTLTLRATSTMQQPASVSLASRPAGLNEATPDANR